MVRSAVVIHLMSRGLTRKTTSSSLVAFERSIEADPDSTAKTSKLSVRTRMLDRPTGEVTSNIERFKGM